MTSQLFAICFGASQPSRIARFWSEFLGLQTVGDPHHGVALLPNDDTGLRVSFVPADEQKTTKNPMHFDLTSTSLEDQQQKVAKALELGARHIDIGQLPEDAHVVLADPEGNEFCVIEPGNNFLAGCGLIGALACDGSQEVGYFWSHALGWPLVWDQDKETAIQSPRGGSKVTWDGRPPTPKTGKSRIHFDLALPAGGDPQAEINRLLSLGATLIGPGWGDAGLAAMTDPDGNEFCLLPPR